jgi:hypothetical protein
MINIKAIPAVRPLEAHGFFPKKFIKMGLTTAKLPDYNNT